MAHHPVSDGILSAIGNTPLVALNKCYPRCASHVYAKLEGVSSGGSAKDRAACSMVAHALECGALSPGDTVIESSSGNMAVGLAQVCCHFGLHLVCVVDAKTTQHHRDILLAYGAEVVAVSEPDPATGEFLPARLARVQQLLTDTPNSFWPNQYDNEYNASAHRRTMQEIVEALEGRVDRLVCPTSTCGTIRGCYEYAEEHGLNARFTAVDAVGSVIFGGKRGPRLLPGHGNALRPALAEGLGTLEVAYVNDRDCVAGCRHLVRSEGILAGASSGGAIAAVARLQREFRPGSNCVVILPDRGERYTDTVFSDEWVRQHLGGIPTLEGTDQQGEP